MSRRREHPRTGSGCRDSIDLAGVSRRHACIRIDGHQASVKDLGSKNGTFLNGQPVREAVPLVDGDRIRLGSVVITFRIPPPPESTDTVIPKES